MSSNVKFPILIGAIPTVSDLHKAGTLRQRHLTAREQTPITPSVEINRTISCIRCSITDVAATCIVNAANESLLGGSGVDGAIHSAAGPDLLKECRSLGGCDTGSAKMTEAYNLPSQHVIHAVGPMYHRAEQIQRGLAVELLANCYKTALNLAKAKGGSIAFSCLSTGIYGFPSDLAAEVACREVRSFLDGEGKGCLDRVLFVLFEHKDCEAYRNLIPFYFPFADSEAPTLLDVIEEDVEQSTILMPQKADQSGRSRAPATSKKAGGKAQIEPKASGDDDWEAVESPDLADSDGENVEKPAEEHVKTAGGFELVEK